MAVPKQRSSKAKKRSRFANWNDETEPNLNSCDHCGEAKLPHRVCMNCGYYDGRKVLNVSEKSTES